MLQAESNLVISDNTIVSRVKCIAPGRKFFFAGSILRASVRKVVPSPLLRKKLKAFEKGQLCFVLVLTTRFPWSRLQTINVISTLNTGCLVTAETNPVGTRIRGCIFREVSLSHPRCRKLLSITEFLF